MKISGVFVSAKYLVEASRGTSSIEKRCVYDVAGKDSRDVDQRDKLSRAFAICRSSLQRSGRMKSGTAELTKMGAKRSSAKAHKKDFPKKNRGFEKLVKAARVK